MKKKTISSIAAIGLAAMVAVPTFSMVASADIGANVNGTIINQTPVSAPTLTGSVYNVNLTTMKYYDTLTSQYINFTDLSYTELADKLMEIYQNLFGLYTNQTNTQFDYYTWAMLDTDDLYDPYGVYVDGIASGPYTNGTNYGGTYMYYGYSSTPGYSYYQWNGATEPQKHASASEAYIENCDNDIYNYLTSVGTNFPKAFRKAGVGINNFDLTTATYKNTKLSELNFATKANRDAFVTSLNNFFGSAYSSVDNVNYINPITMLLKGQVLKGLNYDITKADSYTSLFSCNTTNNASFVTGTSKTVAEVYGTYASAGWTYNNLGGYYYRPVYIADGVAENNVTDGSGVVFTTDANGRNLYYIISNNGTYYNGDYVDPTAALKYGSATTYAVTIGGNIYYYPNLQAANYAVNTANAAYGAGTAARATTYDFSPLAGYSFAAGRAYFNYMDGQYYSTTGVNRYAVSGTSSYATYVDPAANLKYASNTSYAVNIGGNTYYYPNSAAANNAISTANSTYGAGTATYNSAYNVKPSAGYTYSSSRPYFCYTDGNYYSNQNISLDCYYVSSGSSYTDNYSEPSTKAYVNSTVYQASNGYYYHSQAAVTGLGLSVTSTKTPTSTYQFSNGTRPFFAPENGNYYTNLSALYADGNTYYYVVTTTNTAGTYYSTATGQTYTDYATALAASGGNANYVINLGTGSTLDPYYYYYLYNAGNLYGPTNTTKTPSTTTASSTDPYVIVNNKAVYGWAGITSAINSAASGSTLSVKMNEATSIPKSVMTALRSKGSTLKATLANGVVTTIDGTDISSPKTISIDATYNSKNIPSTLVKKAASGATSSAQISFGDNKTFGADLGLTVKFNSSRAGLTATLYRYNTEKGSLVKVTSSKIGSSGAATFTGVNAGGDFAIIIG